MQQTQYVSCLSWNGVGEVRGGCGLLGLGQIDWLNLGFGYVGCDWVGLGGFAQKEAIFVVIIDEPFR